MTTTTRETGITSPRLAALRRLLDDGYSRVLEVFWQEIAAQGAPVVEEIDGDEDHLLVTFLYRGTDETQNVAVLGPWGGLRPADDLMINLPGTDLWYRSYPIRRDVRGTYQLSPNDSLIPFDEIEPDDWEERFSSFVPDPLNPRTFIFPRDEERPDSKEEVTSVLELPDAPPHPYTAPREGVASGDVQPFRLRSEILDNERRIWVYTPPGYLTDGVPYGLLVVFDGSTYTRALHTPTILDNLIADGLIPPLVAVLVDNPGGTFKEAQVARSKELPCHQPFADFLAQELVLWVRERYHVSDDPSRAVVAGSSYGGLAATYAGFSHPEVFGNVLSQSGSFWWKPTFAFGANLDADSAEWEWLTARFTERPRLPIRLYLDVGSLEQHGAPGGSPTQLVANRHMRNVLRARDYPLHYTEYSGGHDYLCWQGTLADGLIALIGVDTT